VLVAWTEVISVVGVGLVRRPLTPREREIRMALDHLTDDLRREELL
jgi:hypothetical protein